MTRLLPPDRVPEATPQRVSDAVDQLAPLLAGRRWVALTGAGCSTESGIPDYRGPVTGGRVRQPLTGQRFVSDPAARRRYWARSFVGWPGVAQARPNPAHEALARLEAQGALTGVLTQNVDGLHQAGGSRTVVELHGALDRVRCLGCGAASSRHALQARLAEENPGFAATAHAVAPDGDVDLSAEEEAAFEVVGCERCGGVLKPAVVFFGEGVSRPVLQAAWAHLEQAEALLVVGSSLTVWSGYRFVRRAAELGRPVGILNLGPTRGDAEAATTVSLRAGAVLPALAARLIAR